MRNFWLDRKAPQAITWSRCDCKERKPVTLERVGVRRLVMVIQKRTREIIRVEKAKGYGWPLMGRITTAVRDMLDEYRSRAAFAEYRFAWDGDEIHVSFQKLPDSQYVTVTVPLKD